MSEIKNPLPWQTSSTQCQGVSKQSFMQFLPASEYHAQVDVLSCSMLKAMLVSPAHFIHQLLAPHGRSEAKDRGTLLHALVLEPHTMSGVAAVFPGELSTKEGREFRAANPDRICIELTEYIRLQRAADAVRAAAFRGRSFDAYLSEGRTEASIYYTDPSVGLACRTRHDLFHPNFCFDIKSSRHATPALFRSDALAMHYDLQAYMYSLARCQFEGTSKPKPFVFVQVESTAPYSVHFAVASESFMENGQRKYNAALSAMKACQAADHWPAPGGEAELDVTPWEAFQPQSRTWLAT
jgi:hypothetical protein